tara:strand:- start:406 stop:585 length:180 start_codon:yes stop_codon:yes gene_type:complete
MSNKILDKDILSNDRRSSVLVVNNDENGIFLEINQGVNKIILNDDEWVKLKNIINSIKV